MPPTCWLRGRGRGRRSPAGRRDLPGSCGGEPRSHSPHLRDSPACRLRFRTPRAGRQHRRTDLHWRARRRDIPSRGDRGRLPAAVGKMRITALETPGHTPESMCFVITDEEKSPAPWAVLTGDTLFIGDVGRPDLSKRYTPTQLAGMLYDSLHNKILSLPTMCWSIRRTAPVRSAGAICAPSAFPPSAPSGSRTTLCRSRAGKSSFSS